MGDVVFSEWVPAGLFVKAIMGFVSVGILCALSITIITGVALQYPVWIVVSVAVTAFLFLFYWNYRGIQIQISEEELLVTYGVFNHKVIQVDEIVACRLTTASFRRYGGVGVRLGFDGSWAYTTSFGDAVRITRGKGRPFVFSSNNAEKLCKIIKHLRNA